MRVYIYIYIYRSGTNFRKVASHGSKGRLSLEILSLAGATSYRAQKGWTRGGRVEGQCILSGGIFTEWEHELAANGMNV